MWQTSQGLDAAGAGRDRRLSFMIRSYGISHVGRVRSNNEDSFAERPEMRLYAVADGMGGAHAGELASRITVDTLVDRISRAGVRAGLDELADAVVQANRAVRSEAEHRPELAGMGTTVVAALAEPGRAYLVNVGDSRAYLARNGKLELVTSDHSWVNEVGRGLGLTDEQLRTHPYRNVLTKAVGAEDDLEAQRLEIEFLPGDVLLLCSDGLHGVAGEDVLRDILTRSESLEEKGRALIEVTLDNGAPDNVTALLVENAAPEQQA